MRTQQIASRNEAGQAARVFSRNDRKPSDVLAHHLIRGLAQGVVGEDRDFLDPAKPDTMRASREDAEEFSSIVDHGKTLMTLRARAMRKTSRMRER